MRRGQRTVPARRADAAFPVEEAEITFWGQCERCRAA